MPRLLAGGINRCPSCRRWMFTPEAPVSEQDMDHTRPGAEAVANAPTKITRTPPPVFDDADLAARQAATLLGAAITFRAENRLADALAAAEAANNLLGEATKSVDGLLVDLRSVLSRQQARATVPSEIVGASL